MSGSAWPDPSLGPVMGAVLCGGRSSRFGSDKALAPAGQTTVGARVVAALREAGVDPVAAIGGTAGTELAIPTVPDLRPGEGPLAALATALLYARTGWVVVVPCDLPLLDAADVAAILDVGSPDDRRPVLATIDGEPQISLGRWPAEAGREILGLVDDGKRRFLAAAEHLGWRGVEVRSDAVSDADTPEELEALLRRGSK